MINVYFDTEFTGLQKDTNLISIGCVVDSETMFYGEITDYNTEHVDNWIQQNVINNLYGEEKLALCKKQNSYKCEFIRGTKQEIGKALKTWLESFEDEIQLVSDVCHYDTVLFIDLFGTAWDLPKNICPCCYDINQDIAKYFNISLKEAFDMNREDLLENTFLINIENKEKHNALFDAIIIFQLYCSMNCLG